MRKQERCKISKYLYDPFERRMCGRDYIEVDGVRVSFAYPYHGNVDLFRCRASAFSLSGYPSIEVQKGYVVLKSERQIYSNADAPSGKEIVSELNSQSESIRSGIEYLARDIAAYNSTLSSSIESALAKRENLSKSYPIYSRNWRSLLSRRKRRRKHRSEEEAPPRVAVRESRTELLYQ